jgi:hypothetical protein
VPAYDEVRAARNWPFLTWTLLAPVTALIVLVILTIATGGNGFAATGIGLAVVAVLAGTALAYRCWPTGMRIDESGITIGAIGARRAERRTPTVNHQAWGLYSCPWSSVHSVRVVTDRAELRHLAKSPDYYTLTNRWGARRDITHCNVGVLTSPFMHAALVAEISPASITATTIRPARFFSNYATSSRLVNPQMSSTWIIPTRHPEALEKALKRYR